ncbi:hypothetical protein ACM66B_005331 [Microbotryomycetes sp. NB124-2]
MSEHPALACLTGSKWEILTSFQRELILGLMIGIDQMQTPDNGRMMIPNVGIVPDWAVLSGAAAGKGQAVGTRE